MLMLYVAAGGAIGSVCRYLLTEWVNAHLGRAFPYATLAANALGALLLGVMVGLVSGIMPRGREFYLLMGMGAAGGFASFSFFAFDTYMLVERGALAQAALYALGSCLLAVAAFFAGLCIYKYGLAR